MITIPRRIVEALEIKGGERLKVLLDGEKKRIIYQKIEP